MILTEARVRVRKKKEKEALLRSFTQSTNIHTYVRTPWLIQKILTPAVASGKHMISTHTF